MSMSKPAIITGIIILAVISNTTAIVADNNQQQITSCAATKYAVPGDSITLTGPTPPQGVAYTYMWTITDSSNNIVWTDSHQSTAYTIPTSDKNPASSYVATLSVGAGTTTSATITGCVLQSCLLINVQLSNTCGISGAQSVCQTDNAEVYSYTGTADIQNKKTAYIKWIVDSTTVNQKDNSGQITVDWTTFWSTSGSGAQTHNVIAEVHSYKSNVLLSTCAYPVTVLPSPVTTITQT